MAPVEKTLLPYVSTEIDRPTLVIHSDRVRRNIAAMQSKASRAGARLRPHFKTHNSHAVGRLFRECGIESITVSSIEMAEYFATDGWRDITIAFPLNVRGLDRIRALSARCQLGIVVESAAAVSALLEAGLERLHVWIEVDTGYGRTGIEMSEVATIVGLAKSVADISALSFAGVLSHFGQSYHARTRREIADVWGAGLDGLQRVMSALAAAGLPGAAMSVGDTPGCTVVEDLHGPDELRPGNFVFYDAQQLCLGVCFPSDLALVVACPVVASYPDRQEVIVQGGAVHLSKDHVTAEDGSLLYGLVMDLAGDWSLLDARTARVTGVSQEHGVVYLERRRCEQTRIGSLLYVVPAHACLAANALGPNMVTV